MAQQSLFRLYTLSLFVTGALKCRVQIVEIVHGSAVTIQALHSDVILHVPDGVYGIILGNIHTDHWSFGHLVGEDDCIIGPICDFEFKGSLLPKGSRFRMQVSHTARTHHHLRGIKVKHGLRNEFSDAKYVINCSQNSNEVYFKYNRKYVDISTRHFSQYIIYAEARNCCSDSIAMLAFSKVENLSSNSLATVILYLCSLHYAFEGYREVSIKNLYKSW